VGFHGFFVFGFKSMTVCPIPASVAYWNGYAPWYRRWRTHNDYHEPILEELGQMVQPGWRVLDIGAGDGVLALPLGERGCRVTALEPAIRLRARLVDEARLRGISGFTVSPGRWEDYPIADGPPPDLALACNSLHLVPGGFHRALAKLFSLNPARVMVVVEDGVPGLFNLKHRGYRLAACRRYETGSHFAYHRLSEVPAHWNGRFGGQPSREVLRDLLGRLQFERGHWWLKEQVVVRIFRWERCSAPEAASEEKDQAEDPPKKRLFHQYKGGRIA
jgi:SAM-dependent methyltransferase